MKIRMWIVPVLLAAIMLAWLVDQALKLLMAIGAIG